MKRLCKLCLALACTVNVGASVAAELDCLIEPSQVVDVRAAVDGLIASVQVRRGDAIRRGQALVELQSAAERVAVEAARFRAQMVGQVESARSRVQYANAKLARLKELQRENFVSAQAHDEAEAERRLAEAELVSASESQELAGIEFRRAQEQLAMRTLLAPFNGVVLDRMLHPGDLAEAGSGRKPVLRVAQIDPLKVDIVVPAQLFGSFKPGMRALVTPKGMAARHAATVTMVDKVIDPASGTFVVRLDLPNPHHLIPGGMRCTALVEGVVLPTPSGARPSMKSAP